MTRSTTGRMMPFFQALGRALMLPIAVLPVAGMLLRLGQPDMLDIGFLTAAGAAVFDNLGLLFAVGVATGFARDGNGAACLAGIVCYLVSTKGAEALVVLPPADATLAPAIGKAVDAAARTAAIHRFDVPLGIVSGLIGGLFYNRFATLRLPDYLAFFGGRRFVPIVSGFAGIGIALALGLAHAQLNDGVDALSQAVVGAGGWGLFLYGVLNRLLIVTGLHHILNNVAYFVVGDYQGTTGDLRRFLAGDPDAGGFMSGFFPVMMFGLPAACLAMYHAAPPERRKAAGGMLLSLALTSFLTGVTEPIEFSFMFLAPALYAFHALMTGLAEAVMHTLGVKLGYGFSAGLFDYVLNYGRATRPLLLLPIGLTYAAIYYVVFRYAIRRWDLPTPGRDPETAVVPPPSKGSSRGKEFVAALGGADNLIEVGACTTRLRLTVRAQSDVNEAALKALGARGVLRPSGDVVQVVLGPVADIVAMEMRAALDFHPAADPPSAVPVAPTQIETLPRALVGALGGSGNIADIARHPGRWRVRLHDDTVLDDAALQQAGALATARFGQQIVHILVSS